MPNKIQSKNNKPQNNVGYRTTNQVQNTLVRSTPRNKQNKNNQRPRPIRQLRGSIKKVKNSQELVKSFHDLAYIHCKLNPWNSQGGGMIPDGSGKRILVDHKAYVDFTTSANGQMAVMVAPTLPSPIFFKSGDVTAFSVNGQSITQATIGTDYTQGWVPSPYYSEFTTNSTPGFFNGPIFNASRARIVTQAYKLTFVGTAQSASGTLTAQTFPLDISDVKPHGNYITRALLPSGSTATDYAAGVQGVSEMELSVQIPSQTAAGTDTVCVRPEAGLVGILKKQSPINEWRDLYEVPLLLIAGGKISNGTVATSIIPTFNSSVDGTSGGGIQFIDDNYAAQIISMRNTQAGSPYRIEVITCVEYTVPTGSMVEKFSRSAPESKPQSIALVDSVLAKTPIAASSNKERDWLTLAMKVINKGATAAVMSGNPYAMGIGAVVEAATSIF